MMLDLTLALAVWPLGLFTVWRGERVPWANGIQKGVSTLSFIFYKD